MPAGGGRYAIQQVAAGGFTPASLPNLVGWWDASNLASITASGGAVSQWSDLGPNGWHLAQPSGGSQPASGAHTQNGLNTIDTAGSKFLYNRAISYTGLNTGTWYVAFEPLANDSNGRILSLSASGEQDYNDGARRLAMLRTGGGDNQTYPGPTVTSSLAPHLFTAQRNGDPRTVWADDPTGSGASFGGNGTTNYAVTEMAIGSQADFFEAPLSAHYFEIIWSADADDATTRGMVYDYIKAKWSTP